MSEARIQLPFLQGISIVLGKGDSAESGLVDANVNSLLPPDGPPELKLTIETTVLSLSFDRTLLRPVEIVERDGKVEFVPKDGNVSIPLPFTLLLSYQDADWSLDFIIPAGDETALSIQPCMIGETGIVVEAHGITLNFSGSGARPVGAPENWRGVFLQQVVVYVPALFSGHFEASGLGIGTGGLYGEVTTNFELHYDPTGTPKFTGDLAEGLLGMQGGIRSIALGFVQNVPTRVDVQAKLLLPFFDELVSIELGLSLDGIYSAKLAAEIESGIIPPLVKDGLFSLNLDSLAFETIDGVVAVKLSGILKLLIGPEWPEIHVDQLSIDSDGNIALDGGWLTLPEQFKLSYKGFNAELTKLGFGTTEDKERRWIGFSGSIQLVDGIGLGGEFEGLRISWPIEGPINAKTIDLSLEGVAVNLTIPDVLSFAGKVNFVHERDADGNDISTGFKGAVKLILYPAKLAVDAEIMIVKQKDKDGEEFTAFYLYLDGNFPAGIPLGATNVAIYGFAGLVGQNLTPTRESEPWYDWYNPPELNPPEPGVTPYKKWKGEKDKFALGAGVTLGTVGDDGHKVNGRLLMVILLSGPTVILEGKVNLLKKRALLNDPSREPDFATLAVLDNRAGTFQLNIDATFKKPSEGQSDAGKLLSIHAGAEAFFDFHRADAWHVYLGQDQPREKRIRADVVSLFKGEAYFMLTARSLRMGFWVGYEGKWRFNVLTASLSAWISADGTVSWKPNQMEGQLLLHGAAKLTAFGRGLSVTVDAGLSGKSPTLWEVDGNLSFKLNLPWPLPDPKGKVHLNWREEVPPPTPLILASVACEHLKVSEKWRCDLLPRYDLGGEAGFYNPNWSDPTTETDQLARCYDEDSTDLVGIPLVPMDVRPVLSFAKAVTVNPALFGHERHGVVEQVGGTQFEFFLDRVALEKRLSAGGWEVVASTYDPTKPPLTGTWQLVDSGNDNIPNQTLMLWSRSTSDWVREQSGPMYWSWLEGHLDETHCPADSPPVERCVDWDDLPPGTDCHAGFVWGGLVFDPSETLTVVYRPEAGLGRLNAVTGAQRVTVTGFPYGTKRVTVCVVLDAGAFATVLAYYQGSEVKRLTLDAPGPATNVLMFDLEAAAIDRVDVLDAAYIYCVCYEAPMNPDRQRAHDTWQTSVDTWDSEDWVLEPYQTYRLSVVTHAIAKGLETPPPEFTERSYFKTGGPPGVPVADANCPTPPPVTPAGAWSDPGREGAEPAEKHQHYPSLGPLQDLRTYIQSTLPAPNARPVYRAYDLRASFNETYVEHMYNMAERMLGLFLYDANGEPATIVGRGWGKSLTRVLTRAEAEWLYGYAKATTAGCLPDVPELPTVEEVVRKLPAHDYLDAVLGAPLKPQMLYEARLVAARLSAPNTDKDQPVAYRWQFITSRYAHFRHHIGSFRDRAWEEVISTEQLDRANAIGAAPADAGKSWRFDKIADALGWTSPAVGAEPARWLRPAPQRLDLTAVYLSNRYYGLLLESPEPLDEHHALVGALDPTLAPAIRHAPLIGGRAEPPGAAKILTAHLDPVVKVIDDEFVDILLLAGADIGGWTLQHRAGTSGVGEEGYETHFTFPAGPPLPDGTLLRIHSGHAADRELSTSAQDVTFRHLYVGGDRFVLSPTGERLRLVDAQGRTIHSRTVLPGDQYTEQPVRIAWNADRTAAFVSLGSDELPSAGLKPMPSGHHRLPCAFVLADPDDPAAPELTLARTTWTETVNLDFTLSKEPLFFPMVDHGSLPGG